MGSQLQYKYVQIHRLCNMLQCWCTGNIELCTEVASPMAAFQCNARPSIGIWRFSAQTCTADDDMGIEKTL